MRLRLRANIRRIRSGCSASGDKIDNQYHDGDDQQKVDQTARYMETEPEQPQNQEDDEDCPKHGYSLACLRMLEHAAPP